MAILIFVSLGTNDKSFKRLLEIIEKEIKSGNIKDEVIVQSGYTKYQSDCMKIIDLMDIGEFNNYISKCDLLITHGGVGTILDGIRNHKKVIAFPRLAKYHEHVNDHQVEIINEFYSNGYILTGEIVDIVVLINKASIYDFKTYKSNNYKFNKNLEKYIKDVS